MSRPLEQQARFAPLARRPGPMEYPVAGWFAPLAAWVYARAIDRVNRRYDQHRGVVEIDRPVISVGNLSVGGTGKTPMVMRLVRELRAAGHDPCVAMRGYRSRDGATSDEAKTYRDAFEDLPIVARPERIDGLLELFASARGERVDCVILDDGFQHRRLARDLDIVLVDATADPFDDFLLPRGWLREPVPSLARAGAVVITHAESVSEATSAVLEGRLAGVCPKAKRAVSHHVWPSLRVAVGGRNSSEPVDWLRAKRVVICCAIGNPGPFVRGVRAATRADPAALLILRDHDPYSPRTIRALLQTLERTTPDTLVVTEKDWAKLSAVHPELWPCPVARPQLAIEFDRGGDTLLDLVRSAAAIRKS